MLLVIVTYAVPVLVIVIQERWGLEILPRGLLRYVFPILMPGLILLALATPLVHLGAHRRVRESILALVFILPFAFFASVSYRRYVHIRSVQRSVQPEVPAASGPSG